MGGQFQTDSPTFPGSAWLYLYPSSVARQLLDRIVVTAFLILAIHIIYNTFFHPISRVPGPIAAKYTTWWLTRRYFAGSWLDDVVRLHQRYGPIVRIAPNEVSFVDEGALRELYGHGKPSQKTPWYDTWVIPGMGDSFFATTDRTIHRRIRSRVSGTYSMSAILTMEELIGEVMELNVKTLTARAKDGKPLRLDQYVNFFTFDVVGQLSMGGPIGFLKEERDVGGLIQSIHDGFYRMANMGHVPGQMFWFNNPVTQYLIHSFGTERMKALSTFMGWLDARVDQRLNEEPGDRRPDMLQYFINGKTPDGNPVSKAEVMIEGVNILGAGADTTTVAILAVLGKLLTHQEALETLRQELDDAHLKQGLQEHESLSFRELEKLPYLTAVIRESTRLHPSITYQLPRVPPPEGIQIAHFHVPSTVSCGISPAAFNRSCDLFGEDADQWIPERWLPDNDTPEEERRLRIMEQNLTTVSKPCCFEYLAYVLTSTVRNGQPQLCWPQPGHCRDIQVRVHFRLPFRCRDRQQGAAVGHKITVVQLSTGLLGAA